MLVRVYLMNLKGEWHHISAPFHHPLIYNRNDIAEKESMHKIMELKTRDRNWDQKYHAERGDLYLQRKHRYTIFILISHCSWARSFIFKISTTELKFEKKYRKANNSRLQ